MMATATKKNKSKPKACDCFQKVNKELESQGIALDSALQMNFEAGTGTVAGPFLAVHWRDSPKRNGKRLPTLTCAYCPFCGKKKS